MSSSRKSAETSSNCVGWRPGFDKNAIVSFLEEQRSTKSDGGVTSGLDGYDVTFRAGEFDLGCATLESAVEIPPALRGDEQQQAVREALFRAASIGRLHPKTFLTTLREEVNKRLSKSCTEFVVVGSLTLDPNTNIHRRLIGQTNIHFRRQFRRRFDIPRREHLEQLTRVALPAQSALCVEAEVKGRHAEHAATVALNSIDYLRGIWNHHQTMGNIVFSWGSIERRSMSPIRWTGPVTVHSPSGEIASQGYLIGSPKVDREKTHVLPANTTFFSREKYVRAKLGSATHVHPIIGFLIAYTKALDATHPEFRYLSLWSLLEGMTGGRSTSNAKVLKNVLKVIRFKSASKRKYYEQVANHLTSYRNTGVHAGDWSGERQAISHQLKFFADHMLEFIISVYQKAGSMDEIGRLLDLPVDAEALGRDSSTLALARRLKWAHDSLT